MTVVKGEYANNELLVYRYLTSTMGLNSAAACGVMANIYQESRFNHLAEGDGGNSYGLCQWYKTRKQSLQDWCKEARVSYTTVAGQMSFLWRELKMSYKSVWSTLQNVPNTAVGAYDAAHKFCVSYERPANYTAKAVERGGIARNSYWPIYSKSIDMPAGTSYAVDYGASIVKIAREQKGVPFRAGAAGPEAFDDSGLVYYCYTKAGYHMYRLAATFYYDKFSESAKPVNRNSIRAGDILFYNRTDSAIEKYYMAIATGEGGRVYISPAVGKVVEEKGIGNPVSIFRVLADSETSMYNDSGGFSDAVEDFTALTVRDDHAVTIEQNLSRVDAVGFDYGYLIDLTHSREFKFYIPEFTETAGASWEDIQIIGRSVSIKAYSHTNSRSISIALDLYAGVGLYSENSNQDIVGKLHEDANFIKSLEYPDYSNSIVRPPSTVQLILGSAITIVGVVSDVSVEHLKPVDSQNRSMYLKVSFSVTQTAANPPDYSDIREGRYVLASTENVSSLGKSNTNAPTFTG